MTEYHIQNYIWENRERWKDLIEDLVLPEKYDFLENEKTIYNRIPPKVLFNEIIDRYIWLYKNLKDLDLFGCEVPLKRHANNTIRADLLGTIPGTSAIVIVELKKSKQTERQAYTELFAYASHLQAIFPTMSNEDIQYVLISPMEERIVREASIYSFLFDEKPVFAYIPIYYNNDLKTLKLRPWLPLLEDLVRVTESAFSKKNFSICKLAWEELENWNVKREHDNPSPEMMARMNRISSYAAQLMEAKKIHGFVYTTQFYPDIPLLKNAIVIGGLNPYRIAKDNYLLREEKLEPHKLDSIADEKINILKIIPELANKAKQVNENSEHLYWMMSAWSNTMMGIANDTVKIMTANFEDLRIEHDCDTMNWKEYEDDWGDGPAYTYDFKTTGLIRKLFVAYAQIDYDYMRTFGTNQHPYLFHEDIPPFAADYIHRREYFLDFLHSIFEWLKEVYEEFEGKKFEQTNMQNHQDSEGH